jgi:hypothetical protein
VKIKIKKINKIPMASRKKGTGQPLLEREKLAIVS